MLGNAAILCSDSQEVVSDYGKTTTQKIRTLHSPDHWRIGLVGAGDAACIDLCQEELWRKLPPARFDYSEMLQIIRETVREVHEEHVWPRQGSANPPTFQLLIALQGLNPCCREVFHTQDSVVLPVDGYRSIGIGSYLSDYLHERVYRHDRIHTTRTEQAARLEVLKLDEVKSAIHGCDGETLIAIFSGDGGFTYMLGREVHEIESRFDEYSRDQKLLLDLVACPEMDEQQFDQQLLQLTANLRLLRARQARDDRTQASRFSEFLKAQRRASTSNQPRSQEGQRTPD